MNVGFKAPPLDLPGVLEGKRGRFRLADLTGKGRWAVVLFYPADFSFICPTEVTGFSKAVDELASLGAEVLGVSADTLESHEAWAKELGGVRYPLLADEGGKAIAAWGVTDAEEPPRALRALFLVDPAGLIAYSVVSRRNVGRSVEETLRVLRALQTGRLCPAGWQPGQPTLEGRR